MHWKSSFLLHFEAALKISEPAAEAPEAAATTEAAEAERATERVATEDVVVAATSVGFLITTVVSLLFKTICLLLGGSYLFFLFTLLPASLNDLLVEVGTYLSVCPFLDDLVWYCFSRAVGDIFFLCVLC